MLFRRVDDGATIVMLVVHTFRSYHQHPKQQKANSILCSFFFFSSLHFYSFALSQFCLFANSNSISGSGFCVHSARPFFVVSFSLTVQFMDKFALRKVEICVNMKIVAATVMAGSHTTTEEGHLQWKTFTHLVSNCRRSTLNMSTSTLCTAHPLHFHRLTSFCSLPLQSY